MSGAIRAEYLSFDHLFAELAVFPLPYEVALPNPISHLYPQMTTATGLLWRLRLLLRLFDHRFALVGR